MPPTKSEMLLEKILHLKIEAKFTVKLRRVRKFLMGMNVVNYNRANRLPYQTRQWEFKIRFQKNTIFIE